MKKNYIAEDGIMISLIIITLYLTSIIPISKLSILTVSSCFIPICLIRTNIKNALLVYIASSTLSLILVPINISIFYVIFFGVYGLIKYYIEKQSNLLFEIILKLIFIIIVLICSSIIFTNILDINIPIYLYIFAALVFFIYDYALSIIINFYINRLYKH